MFAWYRDHTNCYWTSKLQLSRRTSPDVRMPSLAVLEEHSKFPRMKEKRMLIPLMKHITANIDTDTYGGCSDTIPLFGHTSQNPEQFNKAFRPSWSFPSEGFDYIHRQQSARWCQWCPTHPQILAVNLRDESKRALQHRALPRRFSEKDAVRYLVWS